MLYVLLQLKKMTTKLLEMVCPQKQCQHNRAFIETDITNTAPTIM